MTVASERVRQQAVIKVIVSVDPDTTQSSPDAARVRSRTDAENHIAAVSFRCGPPRLLGVELEWTVHHAEDPRKPLDRAVLAAALGDHAPETLTPGTPWTPLPHGSALTVEPGGQVEVSSQPTESLATLLDVVTRDTEYLWGLLREYGLEPGQEGTDPWRPPRRLLNDPRYAALEDAFDRIGIEGKLMMCGTAGVQVCLDAGSQDRVASRWAALHALGPVMIATFGNSPNLFGHRTGWQSARSRTVLRSDPIRTRPGPLSEDPASGWARRMLDTPLACLRRDDGDWTVPSGISFAEWIHGALPGPPSVADLDYHLSTVFPPVRPRGYFEVRYLDEQAGHNWMLPLVAVAALFDQESAVDDVLRLAAPAADRWISASRYGLADPVLANTARAVFDLAGRHLDAVGCPGAVAARLDEAVQRRLAHPDTVLEYSP